MIKKAMSVAVTCLLCMITLLYVSGENSVYGAQSWELVDSNTVWQYYDEEEDPVKSGERTLWTQNSFDVSEWKTNDGFQAKFGAKKGALKEVDSYMPEVLLNQYKEGTTNNIEAFFFRNDFEIEQIPEDYVLHGTIHYDDAALIYLNGELVAEFDNKQKNDSSSGFTANMQYGGHGSSVKKIEFQIDASILNNGINTIAVELHQVSKSSSDIYYEMESLTLEPFVPQQKSVALNVGTDESCRNLTWYYNGKEAGEVHYAKKTDKGFPDEYKVATATVEDTNYGYLYSNKVILTGLESDEEYVYKLVNDGFESDIYSFSTSSEGDFSFLAVGDPQLGNKAVASGAKEWKLTLQKSMETFPETAFLLSAGDQVDKASNELHYDALLENEFIKSLPLATSIGNHDEDSAAYSQHFHNPNVCEYGDSAAGSSYWFTFNNVLFMNMNSNSGSISEHKAFLEEAINANPEAEWKIVTLHHSIYSAANHAEDSGILKRRENYVPMFEELGIDVVFMGHDHVYVRTHIMKDFEAVEKDKNEHFAVDPDGILYLTMNSSSGSKMYKVKDDYDYSAVQLQEQIPNVTNVEVTDDSLRITVHRIDSEMSVADYFVLYNDKMVPQSIVEDDISVAYTRCIYNGTYRKPKVMIDGLTRDDYTVTYTNNKYPGKGKITIKGKGKYKGTIVKTFTIRPKATPNVSLDLYGHDDIKAIWKSVTGADGYRIYIKKDSGSWKYHSTVKNKKYVLIKNLPDGSSYKVKVVPYVEVNDVKLNGKEKISPSVITLKKVKIKRLKLVDSKIKVRWYNISGETGYQISKSTKRTGTNIVYTYKTIKGTYRTITAKKGIKYYYKVRAYKVVDGKKIYGPWSYTKAYRK